MYAHKLVKLSDKLSNWFREEYPSLLKKGLREYRGWTKDILDLTREEDIFRLLVLAINWNTNISWEIGLGTFELLDENGLLTVEKLSEVRNIETIKQMMKNRDFKASLRQRIKLIQKRPYGTKRKTRSGPRSYWADAYHVAAINWHLIREWLKVDEISRGNIPRLNGKTLITDLISLFRIDMKNKKRRMLVVKAFLICRELACQNVVDIDSKYCCVPDYRVREQMKICGFPVSYKYFKNSSIIANYFKKLYDLPLFYFFEYCEKMREKNCSFCLLNDLCAKNYSKKTKSLIDEVAQQKLSWGKDGMLKESNSEGSIIGFLREIVDKINKQGYGVFEVNETSGYFAIQRAGVKRYKNVVCFVKNEHVLSINKYANLPKSLFDNPPYNKLMKRDFPPQGLQLRKENWDLYSINIEYDLKEDKDVIFQLCRKACQSFRH